MTEQQKDNKLREQAHLLESAAELVREQNTTIIGLKADLQKSKTAREKKAKQNAKPSRSKIVVTSDDDFYHVQYWRKVGNSGRYGKAFRNIPKKAIELVRNGEFEDAYEGKYFAVDRAVYGKVIRKDVFEAIQKLEA